MKILSAIYGTLEGPNKVDVTEILNSRIINNTLDIHLDNSLFTDPNPGVFKRCYIRYEYEGEVRETIKYENNFLHLPERDSIQIDQIDLDQNHHNVLMVTSCNRIKQVLLALSINYQIIKKPFSLIIVDSSTPEISDESMLRILQSEDSYNKVNSDNYCSDVNLLYDAEKYFPDLESFKVIHTHPRLTKQEGEATLIALGLTQAALVGDRIRDKQNYCLKLTGTSILNYDALTPLKSMLSKDDVVTWHRTNIGGFERSTRVFGCRPEVLGSLILNEGWYRWCSDNSFLEYKFAELLNTKIPDRINYTKSDDASVLLEGASDLEWSFGKNEARKKILEFIEFNKIDPSKSPYLEDFINGKIY